LQKLSGTSTSPTSCAAPGNKFGAAVIISAHQRPLKITESSRLLGYSILRSEGK
jgi:hypothetical protein